jgi:hypothetical protein
MYWKLLIYWEALNLYLKYTEVYYIKSGYKENAII